jgi:hypothetical protein
MPSQSHIEGPALERGEERERVAMETLEGGSESDTPCAGLTARKAATLAVVERFLTVSKRMKKASLPH